VSTTPGDADWVLSSGSAAFGGLQFDSTPATAFRFGNGSTQHNLSIPFFFNLSVGDTVTSSGPYTAFFTFNTILPDNIDGLALYWGRSNPGDLVSSGSFLAADFDLTGPTSAVPEPSSLALLAAGAVGMFAHGWRRRKASQCDVASSIRSHDASELPAIFPSLGRIRRLA